MRRGKRRTMQVQLSSAAAACIAVYDLFALPGVQTRSQNSRRLEAL
jgi:hypothetical protein